MEKYLKLCAGAKTFILLGFTIFLFIFILSGQSGQRTARTSPVAQHQMVKWLILQTVNGIQILRLSSTKFSMQDDLSVL